MTRTTTPAVTAMVTPVLQPTMSVSPANTAIGGVGAGNATGNLTAVVRTPPVSPSDLAMVLPAAVVPLALLLIRDHSRASSLRLPQSRRRRSLHACVQGLAGCAIFTVLWWFVGFAPGFSAGITLPATVFLLLLMTFAGCAAFSLTAGSLTGHPLLSTLRVQIVAGVFIPVLVPILLFLNQMPDRIPVSLLALAAPVSSVFALWQEHAIASDQSAAQAAVPDSSVTMVSTSTARIQFPLELQEKYGDIRFLGMGGLSRVFKGTRRSDGADVAVKIPIVFDENTGRCFMKEILAWEGLAHPNIVRITEANILPIPYVEMEYVPSTLSRMDRPMPVCEAAAIVAGVASGLAYAHEQGIIHRDIKPQNILITPEGVPKITDWGMSRVMGTSAVPTVAGFSLLYAAPEQVAPATFGETDQRTDIYQLGVLFYEIITGKPLFEGEGLAELTGAIVSTPPPRLPEQITGAAALNRIIGRCLEKRPSDRYDSAAELLRDLNDFIGAECRKGSYRGFFH